jgi:hypothetical protein
MEGFSDEFCILRLQDFPAKNNIVLCLMVMPNALSEWEGAKHSPSHLV